MGMKLGMSGSDSIILVWSFFFGTVLILYIGKKSKRTPTRLRAKIEKAGAAKQRKERKLAKKVCSHCFTPLSLSYTFHH